MLRAVASLTGATASARRVLLFPQTSLRMSPSGEPSVLRHAVAVAGGTRGPK